jgi:diguanylate cyclase (GGDEF)-like protein
MESEIATERDEAPGEDAAALRRAETILNYRLAAVLFLGGGIGAILPDALHQPAHETTVFLLPLLALVSGAIVWALSTRLPRRGLHVVAVVATLEIALTAALADQIFSTYYAFVAIFAAYVFKRRSEIAAHIAFTCVAAFAPVIYEEDSRQALIEWFVLMPTLILAGGAVAFLREQLNSSEERYRRLSECDPLTGVGNYRMLTARVPRELRRHTRFKRPLALFVIDLDDFKRVNDSYGHQRGDAVLQAVGRALEEGVREHDIVVRQGGDEFAVVAPETGEEAARQLAARLRAAVGGISEDGKAIGASIGCARYPEDADTLEGLLASADARLRQAKGEKPRPERSFRAVAALPAAEAQRVPR